MNIKDHANLPQNRSGFWVEKGAYGLFVVYHQGLGTISNSISDSKENLRDRFAKKELASRKVSPNNHGWGSYK